MSELPILVRALDCTISPANVRKTSNAVADAQLEANIAQNGVIQNLIGLPVARKKGKYRIIAGGRRLGCVQRLIEAGKFDTDYKVPVLVVGEPKDAVSISLSENFFTLAMNPAEACRAFQDIIETEKKTPADVAKRFGVTEKFVLGRLRLANLAEPIFEALGSSEITLDVAKAYASTSDVERQAAVFERMSHDRYYGNDVNEIRRRLAIDSYTASDPRAVLVGRDAYIAAGGRIDGDLFTDSSTERWLDIALVDQLVQERLSVAAASYRAAGSYGDVRVVPAVHLPWTETQGLVPIRGASVPRTPEQEKRYAEIETELTALYEIEVDDTDADAQDVHSARIETLEGELNLLDERPVVVSEEQRVQAIAYVVVGQDGQPRLHAQLYAEPASSGTEDDAEVAVEDGSSGGDGEKGSKPRLSQRLLDELAIMKTELIALHIAKDRAFAFDLATFIMIDQAERTYSVDIPSELRAPAPMLRVHGFRSEMPAAEQWHQFDQALDRSWSAPEGIVDRYDAFCALPEDARAAWFGWAIARTVKAVPDGGSGMTLLNHVGRKLGIDVATWWRPTARTYFDRISKALILALFELIGGTELKQRYGGAKKPDLAHSAEKIFAGEMLLEAEVKERALRWIPSQMRLGDEPPMETPANDDDNEATITDGDQCVADDGRDDDGLAEAA